MFEKDTPSKSSCNDSCASQWPPLLSPDFSAPTVVAPAQQDQAGTPILRSDGNLQSIYGGHPLYAFKDDSTVADAKGHCTTAFEGKWYLLKPDGTPCPCGTPAGGGGCNGGGCGGGCGGGGCGGGGSSCSGCYYEKDPNYGRYRCHDSCFNWYDCNGCGSSCGSYNVCGWTPGWRCYDPNPYLSQCNPECCWNAYDSSCKGSNACGGYGGGCTSNTACGWTPGWRCYLPQGGCGAYDKSCLKQCGCYNARDPGCPGFG